MNRNENNLRPLKNKLMNNRLMQIMQIKMKILDH